MSTIVTSAAVERKTLHLRCNNHHLNLTQGISRLLRDDQFVDVTLIVNNISTQNEEESDSNESSIEALDKDKTSDRSAKKTSEILSSKAQITKDNLSNSDSNDNHCTDPKQSTTVKNDDNSCGIGRKLRQKRRNTTHSPNRKVPPFKVKAHKLILSACSPFFEKLFEEDDRAYAGPGTSANTTATVIDYAPSTPGLENEKQCSRHPLVIVLPEDIKPLALTYIIEFMYCGIVEVPRRRLDDVLHAAKVLQIKGLYNSSNDEGSDRSLSSSIQQKPDSDSYSTIRNDIADDMNFSLKPYTELRKPNQHSRSTSLKLSNELPSVSCTTTSKNQRNNIFQHLCDSSSLNRSTKTIGQDSSNIVVITPKAPNRRSSKRKSPPKYHFTSHQKSMEKDDFDELSPKIRKFPKLSLKNDIIGVDPCEQDLEVVPMDYSIRRKKGKDERIKIPLENNKDYLNEEKQSQPNQEIGVDDYDKVEISDEEVLDSSNKDSETTAKLTHDRKIVAIDDLEKKALSILPLSPRKICPLTINLPFSTSTLSRSSISSTSSFRENIALTADTSLASGTTMTVTTDPLDSTTKHDEQSKSRMDSGLNNNLLSIHSSASNPLMPSSDDPQMSPSTSIEASEFGEDIGQSYQATRSVQGYGNGRSYTKEDMEAALDALRDRSLSLTRASEKFGIPPTTLWQRANRMGIATPKKETANKTWSDEDLESALEALRRREISANKAAKIYKIPSSTLYKIARKEKIELAQPFNAVTTTWTQDDLEQALTAIRKGTPVQKAAAEFGIPSGTLYGRCKKVGIELSKTTAVHWSEDAMKQALVSVRSGGMSINQAAIHHNLPYSSLYGRINRLKRGEEEENAMDDTDAVSNSSENQWHQQLSTSEDWQTTSFQDQAKISPSPSLTTIQPFNPLNKSLAFGSSEKHEKDEVRLGSYQPSVSLSTTISPIHLNLTTAGSAMPSKSILSTTNTSTIFPPSMLFPGSKISELASSSEQPEKPLYPFHGSIGSSGLGTSAILGDTILSTVSMPHINPNSNLSNSFGSQNQQQQIANMMMANLITEQARLFHQYSVSSAAMSYLNNTSSSATEPTCSLTPTQNLANCNLLMPNSAIPCESSKPNSLTETASGSLTLSNLLNQKPGLDISLRSNEQEIAKERGVVSSMIGHSTKDLNPKHDK